MCVCVCVCARACVLTGEHTLADERGCCASCPHHLATLARVHLHVVNLRFAAQRSLSSAPPTDENLKPP